MKYLATAVLTFALLGAQTAIASDYDSTVSNFRNAGTGEFIDESYGYAVFPTIGKGGIGIGGAHGKGGVFVGGKQVGNTKMSQITYGLQLGGQAYSQIIFFKDKRAFDDFASGNFEFGAQATAVALTAGAQAEVSSGGGGSASAGTDARLSNVADREYDDRSGMAVFTMAKGGLMYEATIGGQKFSYDEL